MERSGSIRKSMDSAERVLRRGQSMVVFPEGTRSLTGEMAEFLPSLATWRCARTSACSRPTSAAATRRCPKGAALPRKRELSVAFGPFLSIDCSTS